MERWKGVTSAGRAPVACSRTKVFKNGPQETID
jgi:hypothetical protein